MSIINTDSRIGSFVRASALTSFSTEPRSRVSSIWNSIQSIITNTVNSAVGNAAGINAENQALINAQIEAQKQMQLVSLISNIEKSKHETQMAAVRNIRVG